MNVALVHDWLNGMRGGEKVLEVLIDLFPQADLFTLFYEPARVSAKIRAMRPRASLLQRLPGAGRRYRHLLPLYPWAIRRFDLSSYDAVISSSHCAAKGVRLAPGQVHVCYCHAPMRYIWDQYKAYFGGPNRWRPASIAMRLFAGRLRRWDFATAQTVTAFIANSAAVAERIAACYGRPSTIVHPPADTDRFRPAGIGPGEHFLTVAALVPYKRIELAIAACNRLRRPLVVVGQGPERRRLEALAGPTVTFRGWVSDDELVALYNGCRALLYPGEEDFGIAMVEAQACGRPVVALRKGGAREIVLDRRTGLLFDEPSVEALCAAITQFDRIVFDRGVIRAHAEHFGGDRCRRELGETLYSVLHEHGIQTPSPIAL